MASLSMLSCKESWYHLQAFPISLATTFGISVDVFSSSYWDVSVHPVRLSNLCIQLKIPIARWVPPFRNLRIKANLPAPRSLSQAITSFVAYHCQGIHHVLLFTWPYNFDFSPLFSRNVCQVFHLTRYAVSSNIVPNSNYSELKLEIKSFFWRNQKISLNCY